MKICNSLQNHNIQAFEPLYLDEPFGMLGLECGGWRCEKALPTQTEGAMQRHPCVQVRT